MGGIVHGGESPLLEDALGHEGVRRRAPTRSTRWSWARRSPASGRLDRRVDTLHQLLEPLLTHSAAAMSRPLRLSQVVVPVTLNE